VRANNEQQNNSHFKTMNSSVVRKLTATLLPLVVLAPAFARVDGKAGDKVVQPAAGPPRISSNHLYVAVTGSDSNPGTPSAPFKTIAKASQGATPGTVVHVAPGLYPGGFQTIQSGSESQRIRYVSERKWGARIVPVRDSANDIAWDNRGSYVEIDGFEIDASIAPKKGGIPWRIGIYNGGSYNVIKNNHIHHIARRASCISSGGSAINSDHYHHGVASDVVDNVVHHIGYAGCEYIQGIYVSTSGSVVNNLVYNIGGAAIHLWHDANDVTIKNNTVFGSKYGIIVGGGDFYHRREPADNIRVSNNIVFDNAYGVSEQGSVGHNNSYRDNMVYQNAINWNLKKGKRDPDF
jgi:hypothetical protein